MSFPEILYTVHISVVPNLLPSIEATLELLDLNVSCWHDTIINETRIDIFFESMPEAKEFAQNISQQLSEFAEKDSWDVNIEEIPNQQWQNSWKEFFHVERVSEHIVIKPSHEEYSPEPGDCVINIDPGMSFGTGQHETTKACLKFLDKLCDSNNVALGVPVQYPEPKQSFLDLGCGSGILSIAAAQLGYTPIAALDIDPDSITISNENFEANSVENCIEVSIGDVSKLEINHKYSVVTANILAPILLANAEQIASTVSNSSGYLVLAGILNEQYDEIATAYSALGFKQIEIITENEWTSGCFILNL